MQYTVECHINRPETMIYTLQHVGRTFALLSLNVGIESLPLVTLDRALCCCKYSRKVPGLVH